MCSGAGWRASLYASSSYTRGHHENHTAAGHDDITPESTRKTTRIMQLELGIPREKRPSVI